MAARVELREISNEEGNRLLRVVRRSSGSVVTWRLDAHARSTPWGAQIHPSCCLGVFVDESAESVASVELVWRVRADEV
jgi:hypothetical protein